MPRHHSKLNAWLIISKQQCEKSSSRCGILFVWDWDSLRGYSLIYVGIPSCSELRYRFSLAYPGNLIDRQDFNLDLIMVRWTRRCSAAAENVPKAFSQNVRSIFGVFLFAFCSPLTSFFILVQRWKESSHAREKTTIKINYEKQWKKSLIVAEETHETCSGLSLYGSPNEQRSQVDTNDIINSFVSRDLNKISLWTAFARDVECDRRTNPLDHWRPLKNKISRRAPTRVERRSSAAACRKTKTNSL